MKRLFSPVILCIAYMTFSPVCAPLVNINAEEKRCHALPDVYDIIYSEKLWFYNFWKTKITSDISIKRPFLRTSTIYLDLILYRA